MEATGANDRSVILVEFNELSPSLMFRFMGEGKLPSFQRMYDEAHVYLTDAEAQEPYLNPWVQWVTVHSGLPYQEHRIFNLGEGHFLQKKCVWDLLSGAGLRVWVCGSMNVRYDTPLNGYLLPDPWTTAFPPCPESLGLYFRFVQQNVLEYTRGRVPLSKRDYLDFMGFMATHGLSAGTVSAILRQLLSEHNGRNRWKRAVILDKLQLDLFRSVFRRYRPHFSTFFSNSTAHFQHAYWRNLQPELFKIKPTAQEQADFESAILFGYQEMDKLLGSLLQMCGSNTTLIFCTALSQQPCLVYEEEGGKTFYRPLSFEQLLEFAGLAAPYKVSPVMAEQFHVHLETPEQAETAEGQLRALRVAGRPVFYLQRNGSSVFAGCTIFDRLPPDAEIRVAGSERSMPFFRVFYHVEAIKSGMHHPDGLLWIRYPERQHVVHSDKQPLTVIAPTILDMFSLPRPDFMKSASLLRPSMAHEPSYAALPRALSS